MAVGGKTSNAYMARVVVSNMIWRTTGESVRPMDVDDYPRDWLDAITAFAVDLPKRRAELRHG